MATKKNIKPDPIVILNDIYQVRLDPRCLILNKKIQTEDDSLSAEEKKEGYKIMGYFTTWESLGKSLIGDMTREKISKEGKVSLEDYIKTLIKTNKEIECLFKEIDTTKVCKK